MFNTIQAEYLKNNALNSSNELHVPYAAQNYENVNVVRQLIENIGFNTLYLGDLTNTYIKNPEHTI